MPKAVNHLWEVLLVSGLCQSEHNLHEVSVHQSTVCTFCCLQSLTKGEKWTDSINRLRDVKTCLAQFYEIYVLADRELHHLLDVN